MIESQAATLERVRHSYASSMDDSIGQIINITTGGNMHAGKTISPTILPSASRVNEYSRPQTNTASIFTHSDSLGQAKHSLKSNNLHSGMGGGGGLISSRKQGGLHLANSGGSQTPIRPLQTSHYHGRNSKGNLMDANSGGGDGIAP